MERRRKEDVFDLLPEADALGPRGVFFVGEGTSNIISDKLDMGVTQVQTALRRLRDEGRAYIHTWTAPPNSRPIWARGKLKDWPKPIATREQKNANAVEYQRRMKLAREHGETALSVGRVRAITEATIERARAHPRRWWTWLFELAERAT